MSVLDNHDGSPRCREAMKHSLHVIVDFPGDRGRHLRERRGFAREARRRQQGENANQQPTIQRHLVASSYSIKDDILNYRTTQPMPKKHLLSQTQLASLTSPVRLAIVQRMEIDREATARELARRMGRDR